MPLIAASDLGLHCLPMSPQKDARLIWVNYQLKPVFWVLKITHQVRSFEYPQYMYSLKN